MVIFCCSSFIKVEKFHVARISFSLWREDGHVPKVEDFATFFYCAFGESDAFNYIKLMSTINQI